MLILKGFEARVYMFLKGVYEVGAKPEEVIDKRHKDSRSGYLAPNGSYYFDHCIYCAEVAYLMDIYSDTNQVED